MISSLKKENVCVFKREEDGSVGMEPAHSQTYGCSFDVLIKNYYGLRSLISQSVIENVKQHLPAHMNPESVAEAKRWIESNLGDSMEKAYLLRKLEG